MKVISFAYPDDTENLKVTEGICRAVGLAYYFDYRKSTTPWLVQSGGPVQFILDNLLRLKEDILFVSADMKITGFDINGFNHVTTPFAAIPNAEGVDPLFMKMDLIFCRYEPIVINALTDALELMKQHSSLGDHRALCFSLSNMRGCVTSLDDAFFTGNVVPKPEVLPTVLDLAKPDRKSQVRFITCAFYTKGTDYENEIKGLVADLDEFNLPRCIQGVEPRGSWELNCAIKPEFLADMLRIQKRPILYLDADARIRQFPELAETMAEDIGVYYQNNKVLSGTIILNNTPATADLLDTWIKIQHKFPTTWDQKTLALALEECSHVSIKKLPAPYCLIFDIMRHLGPPIIEHFQASRRFKRKVFEFRKDELPTIPEKVCGCIPKRIDHGGFQIPIANPKKTRHLENDWIQIDHPNRWYPRPQKFAAWARLEKAFKGKGCYVIGKGPSLDDIRPTHFTNPDWPIIAINEAIKTVELLNIPNPIFAMHQDTGVAKRSTPEDKTIMILTSKRCYRLHHDYWNKFILDHYISRTACITPILAIRLGKKFSVTQFHMLGFDACCGVSNEYAKSIGYSAKRGGSLSRFKSHKSWIEREAKGVTLTWVHPKELLSCQDTMLPSPISSTLKEATITTPPTPAVKQIVESPKTELVFGPGFQAVAINQ